MAPHFDIERRLLREGRSPVAGIDEVGRGPLAGPVAAAAVILDPDRLPPGIRDSKALAPAKREEAFEAILSSASAVCVAFGSVEEIDRLNIRGAALLAMARAAAGLGVAPSFALVDGRDLPDLPCAGEAIVGGDALSFSIAAASIVAKVARDRLMRRLASLHPSYGFETNMGYGVKKHLEALSALGPTPFHRLSFAPVRAASRPRP